MTTLYSDTLPKKYMAAGAIFFNEAGELLLLHPTYKDRWEIPGGIVEADESPLAACKREIKEEIGLEINVTQLLVVDYSINMEGVENLQFVFDGGVLTKEQISSIILPPDEITSYEFVSISTEEDRQRIASRDRLGPRTLKAIEARAQHTTFYLQTGILPT